MTSTPPNTRSTGDAAQRHGPWAVLFGQSRRTTDRFLLGAGCVFLLALGVHWLGLDSSALPLSIGDRQLLAAAVIVVVSGASAYLNDGLLTSVVLAYLLLVAGSVAGVVPVGVADSDWSSVVYVLLVLPLAFAVVLGGGGGLVGALIRRAVGDSRSS